MTEHDLRDEETGASSADFAMAAPLTKEQAISNLLQQEDPSLRYYAAWWLGKFRIQEDIVVEALIAALDDETDRTELGGYPLRRNAARALGKIGDRRAVHPLMQSLNCSDFYVQESAAQSLGMLGDPICIPQLMAILEGGVESAPLAVGRPHLTKPVEAAMEALEALRATEAIPLIEPFLQHSMQRVQQAAARAMHLLTQNPVYGDRLVQALQTPDLKIRRSVLLDLGASGYMPGATAIAQAAVENSYKMIALKSLLENHLRQVGQQPISSNAQQVMTIMDSLL